MALLTTPHLTAFSVTQAWRAVERGHVNKRRRTRSSTVQVLKVLGFFFPFFFSDISGLKPLTLHICLMLVTWRASLSSVPSHAEPGHLALTPGTLAFCL